MTIAIFVGSLLAAMALGIPISFALLVCGAALMVHLGMFDAQILAQNVIHGADSYPLLAVPFFLLAGELMNVGGLSKRIVNVALVMVGHIRGGLGYVTIVAACLLAALSGSAIADAAALSTMLLPMMVAAGYDKGRSAGLIASAGIIAPVVPPSIGFVIFGVAANVSISKLFFAGIFPALMLAATLWFTWWWLARKETMASPARKSLAEVLSALGTRHAYVVHGAGDIDELSPCGPNLVCEVVDGEVREWQLDPGELEELTTLAEPPTRYWQERATLPWD